MGYFAAIWHLSAIFGSREIRLKRKKKLGLFTLELFWWWWGYLNSPKDLATLPAVLLSCVFTQREVWTWTWSAGE